jgi:hypothetical protein
MINDVSVSPAKVGFARFFVGGIGVAALGIGVAAMLFGEGAFFFWGGVGLVVAGVAGLLLSIASDGHTPVQAARDIADIYFDQ